MRRFLVALSAVAMAFVGLASPAAARPALVSAEPAQASVSARVNAVKLTFSEPVLAEASGMELVMTEMPGMAGHQPMKITGARTSLSGDGLSLVASLSRPLPVGSYEAVWHAAGGDPAQKASGKLTFSVR